MKIVHSYWSKPTSQSESSFYNRAAGGWLDQRYHLMSWALSCSKAASFYDEIELVTDQEGANLLINKLNLPYTNVQIVLDQINHFPPGLWALGKIFSYSIQNEPFLHIDSDVYIWDRFSETIENAELVAQHEEKDYEMYYEILKWLNDFPYLPELLADSSGTKIITASNAGILGGKNVDFFKKLWEEVLNFITKNEVNITKVRTGFLNNIYEQLFFNRLALKNNIEITYLLPNISSNYEGLIDIYSVPHRTTFIHVIGTNKRHLEICEWVAFRLKLEFPDYYFNILNLINEFEV